MLKSSLISTDQDCAVLYLHTHIKAGDKDQTCYFVRPRQPADVLDFTTLRLAFPTKENAAFHSHLPSASKLKPFI
jgi:hypothetical protein